MNSVPLIFLAFVMSIDAFATAIGKGSSLDRPRLSEVLCTGIISGVIEAIIPLASWLLGQAASQFVTDQDHWAVSVLLVLFGLHMIHDGLRADHAMEQEKPGQHSPWILAVTVLAISVDALAVGVGLAFVDVNISLAAGAIGLATMTMAALGTMLGRAFGAVTGKRAEMVDGVVLILAGTTILYKYPRAARTASETGRDRSW